MMEIVWGLRMKNAMKQMALFALLANVIGVVTGLLNFGFVWPVVVSIAYIFFDLKLDINGTYRFTERFLIYFVITVIWWIITSFFAVITLWAVTNAPWVGGLEEGGYDLSYAGLIYGLMFALMYVCVPLVIGIAFVIRSIRGTGKK